MRLEDAYDYLTYRNKTGVTKNALFYTTVRSAIILLKIIFQRIYLEYWGLECKAGNKFNKGRVPRKISYLLMKIIVKNWPDEVTTVLKTRNETTRRVIHNITKNDLRKINIQELCLNINYSESIDEQPDAEVWLLILDQFIKKERYQAKFEKGKKAQKYNSG